MKVAGIKIALTLVKNIALSLLLFFAMTPAVLQAAQMENEPPGKRPAETELSETQKRKKARLSAQEDLWEGVTVGDVGMVEKALKSDANVNAKNDNGETVLILSVKNDHKEMVELLLGAENIDVNLQNDDGETALMWAAEKGYEEIVKLLLANGANLNMQDNDGGTALTSAEDSGNQAIVKLLIDWVKKKQLTVTEEQRQKLAKEQNGVDLITMEDITQVPLEKLVLLARHLYLTKTIMDHMISKVGSREGIGDPFTRQPIPVVIQRALLAHFELPENLLEEGGPIYQDAVSLQVRENLIIDETDPERIKELENETVGFKQRIRDTLAKHNYNVGE